MSVDLAATLERELGGDVLECHEPDELDGVALAATLRPVDGPGLGEAVRALGRHGLAAVLRGAGRHLSLGNPPSRADVFLATDRLAGVDTFEAGEGVCHAAAGTRLAELRRVVGEQGWEIPIDAPAEATLGGALAAAALGPRSHGYGLARDAVLGLEVVLGSGERTRCGGRVVKNVTGYDLAKLYVGSLGTLAVIEGAWLRLRPRPEATRVVAASLADLEAGCAFALEAARRVSTRACALWGSARRGYECVVELAGDELAVAHDAQALAAEVVAPQRLAELAEVQSGSSAGDLVLRIAALPTALPAIAHELAAAGAELAVHPGLRLLYARFVARAESPPAYDEALRAAASAARRADAALRIESAPPAVKRGRDVFGAGAAEIRLVRALKTRFDPQGTLAPGRAAGAT